MKANSDGAGATDAKGSLRAAEGTVSPPMAAVDCEAHAAAVPGILLGKLKLDVDSPNGTLLAAGTAFGGGAVGCSWQEARLPLPAVESSDHVRGCNYRWHPLCLVADPTVLVVLFLCRCEVTNCAKMLLLGMGNAHLWGIVTAYAHGPAA